MTEGVMPTSADRLLERVSALHRLNAALGAELRSLADENRRQAASIDELEHFAYVAAHDMSAPLRQIVILSEILMAQFSRDSTESDSATHAQTISKIAGHMQEMLDSILEHARVGTENQQLNAIECEELVKLTLDTLRSEIDEASADVTFDSLPSVFGDRQQLLRLFQNLLGNALRYRGIETPTIQISARRNLKNWEFSVRDNGIGIGEDQADGVFELFARVHSDRENSGSGIGLAICKQIVGRHGGRIWFHNNPDRGVTFSFTIPTECPAVRLCQDRIHPQMT